MAIARPCPFFIDRHHVEKQKDDCLQQYYQILIHLCFKFEPQIMTSKEEVNHFELYKAIKEQLNLPLKIKMFYSILQDCCQKQANLTASKDLQKKYKKLISVFKHQTYQQKTHFLHETIKSVRRALYDDSKEESYSSQSDGLDQIKQIQTTCKVKESVFGLTKWEKRNFKLSRRSLKVKISEGKRDIEFKLPHYFMRKSHKHSKTLILEAITETVEHNKNEIYIYFDNAILFHQIYCNIFSCIVENAGKELIRLLHEKDELEEPPTTAGDMSKANLILTPKVLSEYFTMKDKILRKLQNCSYNFEAVESNLPGTKIGVSQYKKKERVKIQKILPQPLSALKNKISLLRRSQDSNLIEFEVLQKFSSNISVCYFKYLFNDQVYQFLTILEENVQEKEHTLFLKGIDNFINIRFVDFLCLKIKETDPESCILRILGIFQNSKKDSHYAVNFLLSMIKAEEKKASDNEEQFWTVRQMENVQMQEQEDISYVKQMDLEYAIDLNQNFKKKQSTTSYPLHLQKKYIQTCTPETLGIFLEEHPLFSQWKVASKGGVICTNEEQIDEQKKVFKNILSQIGSNIMARKNIMNVSLPVTIFRKQSHLKSVARNFSYAPMLLEKSVNGSPLDKMKQAVLFQISMSVLTISMNKPFNPILGQTYQGFIDGCPIEMEQISHHPPISAFQLTGRGYKIRGLIDPKVSVGLNCVKGYSPPPCFIQYDDGTVIEFTINKLVIGGMLFGERTFTFEGTNLIVDRKNKLVGDIFYGKNSHQAFKKIHQTCESVSGLIYDLSCSKQKNTDLHSMKREGKPQLSLFEGIWHSQIRIDSEKVIDFRQDLPHAIMDHQYPIPSDSRYRNDLKALIEGSIEEAQRQKDFGQEIQRRDKKLREQYKKCKK